MTELHNQYEPISAQLNISLDQVRQTAILLDEGATVPFLARYRKELTGSLDEVAIAAIRDQLVKRADLHKRRLAIIDSLQKRELLTETLLENVNKSDSLTALEDIYLPFRPKRKTRGMIACERGLKPLADLLKRQKNRTISLDCYLSTEHEIYSVDDVLSGARDILAEYFNENPVTRKGLRTLYREQGVVRSKVVKKNREQAVKFRNYFDWQEPVSRIAGHRLLALFRGESEHMLTLSLRPPEDKALNFLIRHHARQSPYRQQIIFAIEDSYKRLLAPSLENGLRRELKERADAEAITVFVENLRELLMAPPLGQKSVLALDPGYRTGAKLVCLDAQGQLLHTTNIYPTHGPKQRESASKTVKGLMAKYRIEAVAIGNGTAGRETEAFIRQLDLGDEIIITLVNEDGASIYSASETARSEFPDHDITVRGSVSIGRRLQDPLAELVKIEPKSIGVGQYQHDVNQADLKASLEDVVASCVNNVGVELNTASIDLLTYVSGLGPVLAANIVSWRNENGPFKSRKELLKVPRLGAKAFQQAAGFLRISNGENPLDASAVHPERYNIICQMALDTNTTIDELIHSEEARSQIKIENYLSDCVGLPTLQDILAELAKPGRDPRKRFQQFSYAEGVKSLEDLETGMKLPAIITNVTKFGAFADIGVHQDGLIHISQLADHFVKDPSDIVKVRQHVEVRILEVDLQRKRISLSMKTA